MAFQSVLVRELENDYDAAQLVPQRSETTEDASYKQIEDLVKKLSENNSMRMRFAVAEAVLDEVIGDTIDEKEMEENGIVNVGEVDAVLEPVVEKAVDLGIIPSAMKARLPHMIAEHMKRRNPRMALYMKAAHYAVASVVKLEDSEVIVDLKEDEQVVEKALEGSDDYIPEVINNDKPEEQVVSKTLDDQAADTGVNINNESITEREEDPVVEVIEEQGIPVGLRRPIKNLATSSAKHKRDQVIVARRYAGVMVDKLLHEMRYALPKHFVKKYDVK